jgi:hypothetical protein
MTDRRGVDRRLAEVLRGERVCGGCGQRPPRTPAHGRCWQCARGGGQAPPPCRGCGGEYWTSGWCRECHPCLRGLPRSCRTCLAWGTLHSLECAACRTYGDTHPLGDCLSCGRRVPVNAGYCRLCRHQARVLAGPGRYGPAQLANVARTGQQLFLAHTQRTLWSHLHAASTDDPRPVNRMPKPGDAASRPVYAELFSLPEDLVGDRILRGDEPREDFYTHISRTAEAIGQARGWTLHMRNAVAATLEALIARHPAGTALFTASSATPLAGNHRNITRTLEVLDALGMLDDDQADPLETWLGRQLSPLPQPMSSEVGAWVRTLRDGDARRRSKSELTWRHYLIQAIPALQTWSADHTSLREITHAHILAVLKTPCTGDGHGRVTALRSLFRFLTATRRTFTDPTLGLPPTVTSRALPSIPTRLDPRTLAKAAASRNSPSRWLVTVLTAHHALGAARIRALTLTDIDLPARVLCTGRAPRPIDALTARAIENYLAYRGRQWPRTANPHLLINQRTAHYDTPVSRAWIYAAVRAPGTAPRTLREDRILEEVEALGVPDPLHIAAMFALHPITAQRYLDAIYPPNDDMTTPEAELIVGSPAPSCRFATGYESATGGNLGVSADRADEGRIVPLTFDEITPNIGALHQAAEAGFMRDGRVLGTVALIMPDASIGAVIPFGPKGNPPSDEFIAQHAVTRGAVGLALTAEHWVNPEPVTRRQAALDPQDLPLPTTLDPTQRGEQIMTTAVLRGYDLALRFVTPVLRGAFGTSLGERRSIEDDLPMAAGDAQHLKALLA